MTVSLIIHVVCKSCEPEIVFVLICTLEGQFHVQRSYKMHQSTMSCIGNFEENIDLFHVHLAVFLAKDYKYRHQNKTMFLQKNLLHTETHLGNATQPY